MVTRSGQTICLCMIVKNEALVIRRCLDSVRPVIDHWVIVDTGSTDGTQDIIREALVGLPGELVERPWRDFAANRSEALALARPHGVYSLVIDADDALELDAGFQMPALDADSYMIEIKDTAVSYRRMQLFNNRLPWCYRGVLHEFPACEGSGAAGYLPLVMRRNHDGARRRDAQTYTRDAALLEAALATETDAFMRSRYMFYLGQSYRDCGATEKAAAAYLQRAEMGFWAQEVFVALYKAGQLREALGAPFDEVLAIYERASAAAADRAEALHAAARLCRNAGRNAQGYEIAKRGLTLSVPAEGLFVEGWIYDYGLLDEYAVNAYWAGRYQDCLDASLRILACKTLPEAMRGRVLENARFAAGHWPPPAAPLPAPNLGRAGEEGFVDQHRLRPARNLYSRLAAYPRVLVAILAKQAELALPLYLDCIETLDYPKSAIFLYIRTNNNTDGTEAILRDWVARVGGFYAGVEFDAADVSEPVQQFGVHEWNAVRFKVLGEIRAQSLQRALALGCDFYFVADVDNFVLPWTLRELVALSLPVVAPFLRLADRRAFYSNFHAEIDEAGYFAPSDQYQWLLNRWVKGVVEVPVVHTTYLVRADVIPCLAYQDASERHEYVIFSESARRAGVPQYLDNRQVYGYVTFESAWDNELRAAILRARHVS